jgi:hypothetical protein
MKAIMFAMLVLCSGCYTMGPYVKKIASDGAGKFSIESCSITSNVILPVMVETGCKTNIMTVAK